MFDPRDAMTIMLDDVLPEYPSFDPAYRRAPRREAALTQADKELAIRNALRYIPQQHHAQMAVEFAKELEETGRIYGYRFRPEGKLIGKPIDEYKGNCVEATSKSRLLSIMTWNALASTQLPLYSSMGLPISLPSGRKR